MLILTRWKRLRQYEFISYRTTPLTPWCSHFSSRMVWETQSKPLKPSTMSLTTFIIAYKINLSLQKSYWLLFKYFFGFKVATNLIFWKDFHYFANNTNKADLAVVFDIWEVNFIENRYHPRIIQWSSHYRKSGWQK